MGLLGTIVLVALLGLSLDGNWPKVMRVGSAFFTYSLVLLGASRWSRHEDLPLHWVWYSFSAMTAGVVSGLMQPVPDFAVVLVGAACGGLLLGPPHYLAVRAWSQAAAAHTSMHHARE